MWQLPCCHAAICALVACVIFHTVAYRYLTEILMLETCWWNPVRNHRLRRQLTSLAMLYSRSDVPITKPMYDCRRPAAMRKTIRMRLIEANICDLE